MTIIVVKYCVPLCQNRFHIIKQVFDYRYLVIDHLGISPITETTVKCEESTINYQQEINGAYKFSHKNVYNH